MLKFPRSVSVSAPGILPVMILAAVCWLPPLGVAQQSAQQAAQQSTPPPAQPSAAQAPQDQKPGDSQGPAETIKANVNVVSLFFNVKDKHGALVPNLPKEDFEIFEDGKPQTIKYFTAETNLPLTLGIM